MKPSGVMPAAQGGGGTCFDRLPNPARTSSTMTMPMPKVSRIWSSAGGDRSGG